MAIFTWNEAMQWKESICRYSCCYISNKESKRQRENSKSRPLAMGPEAYLHQTEDATREAHPYSQRLYECVDTCSLQSSSGSLHQL